MQPRSELSMSVLVMNTSLAKAQILSRFLIRGDEVVCGCLIKSIERMPAMGPKRRCVGQQVRHHCRSWMAQPYPNTAICSCSLPLTCSVDAKFHLQAMAGPAHAALTNSQPDSFLLLTHMHTAITSQVFSKPGICNQKKRSLLTRREQEREK